MRAPGSGRDPEGRASSPSGRARRRVSWRRAAPNAGAGMSTGARGHRGVRPSAVASARSCRGGRRRAQRRGGRGGGPTPTRHPGRVRRRRRPAGRGHRRGRRRTAPGAPASAALRGADCARTRGGPVRRRGVRRPPTPVRPRPRRVLHCRRRRRAEGARAAASPPRGTIPRPTPARRERSRCAVVVRACLPSRCDHRIGSGHNEEGHFFSAVPFSSAAARWASRSSAVAILTSTSARCSRRWTNVRAPNRSCRRSPRSSSAVTM